MSYDLRITSDEIFKKSQPAKSEELVNFVEVSYFTPETQEPGPVYTSQEITLAGGQSTTIEFKYSEPPVKGATAERVKSEGYAAINLTITASSLYAWGGSVTVSNSSAGEGKFKVVVTGQAIKFEAALVTKKDDQSILENGLLKYTYPENRLIQTKAMAEKIADGLLASYKTPRKDVSIEWIGNPALELGDTIEVPEYQKQGLDIRGEFSVYKNKIEFDGTLRQSTEGRKIQS
jgi:hypothetical protein